MPLLVNLRHLEKKALQLEGELTARELDLAQINALIELRQPLFYELEVERLGHDLLLRGRLEWRLDCECARCLRAFERELVLEDWVCDVPLEGEEKALVVNDCVDLTPYVREDMVLAFPQHPLCSPECRGLPEALPTGKQTSGARPDDQTSSAWAALNKLKL